MNQLKQPMSRKIWDEIQERLDGLIDIASQMPGREGQSALVGDIKHLGELLYHGLIPDQIGALISQATDIHLYLDWQTAAIPWELLYDGREFLAQNKPLSRQISLSRSSTTSATRSRSVLVFQDNDGGRLGSVADEARLILDLYEKYNIPVDLIENANRAELLAAISSHALVHYAGHGEADRIGAWPCNDGLFKGSHLHSLRRLPKFLFSNSCTGADTRPGTIARAFIELGLNSLVGPIWKVPDNTALNIARDFYKHLLDGQSMASAMYRTRKKYSGEAAWAGYVVYTLPGQTLRDIL